MKEMIENWKDCIEDVEEGPLFWFALADTQWKYGLLDEKLKDSITIYRSRNRFRKMERR